MDGPSEDIERMVARLTGREGGEKPSRESGESGSLYEELHGVAEKLMREERGGHTLQATALVHEAYLRLIGSRNLEGSDRLRFLDAAAVAMRRILVDHARKVRADKRGGTARRVSFQGLQLSEANEEALDVLALQEALQEFEALDARAAKIVELRFFAGLSGEEIAEHLGISRNTVVRELTHARAWLERRLGHEG